MYVIYVGGLGPVGCTKCVEMKNLPGKCGGFLSYLRVIKVPLFIWALIRADDLTRGRLRGVYSGSP